MSETQLSGVINGHPTLGANPSQTPSPVGALVGAKVIVGFRVGEEVGESVGANDGPIVRPPSRQRDTDDTHNKRKESSGGQKSKD